MQKDTISYKNIFAALIGNCLEWYDYSLAGLIAPIFAITFFGEVSAFGKIVFPLMIFGLGTFFRPIGAILFAYFGDRAGRRATLIFSISIVVIGMLSLGFLPPYATIGITATILFTLINILNGLSFGAELPVAVSLLYESSPKTHRTYVTSLIYCGALFGMMLGSFDFSFFTIEYGMNTSSMWRLPFFMAGILGIIGFILRKKIHESPLFLEAKHKNELRSSPTLDVLREHPKEYFICCALAFPEAIAFHLILIFTPTLHYKFLGRNLTDSLILSMLTFIIAFLMIPFFGKLANRIGKYKLLLYSSWSFVLLTVPLYDLIISMDFGVALTGQIILSLLLSTFLAPYPASLSCLFPTYLRCSGISLSHNVVVAIFGGTAPLLVATLIHFTGIYQMPAFYIAFSFLCSLLVLLSLKDRHKQILSN